MMDFIPKEQADVLPPEEMFKRLDSKPAGLTESQARARLDQVGYNELQEKKQNPFLKFLSYFWGPIPWMIEAAAILSALIHHWADMIIISVLLLGNALVGFWEEHQADNAIEALKANLSLKARVHRDGKWITVPSRELVPGDRIRLRIGDIVPADAKLLEEDPLELDQSALTGESLPVKRRNGETIYSGSIVKKGEGEALVFATGQHSFFGKTAKLVESAETVSHFQKAVLAIGNYLIVLAVALVLVIIGVAVFRGDRLSTTLQFALVLTVAAIPVAMPTVLSVTMAVGARLLAKKEAIVSRLAAIEELAGMDMLCSDKTGTLTQNKITLGNPFSIEGIDSGKVVFTAALASHDDQEDAIDLAVMNGLKDKEKFTQYKMLHFQPFDPVQKYAKALVQSPDGQTFEAIKGAPQVVLAMADNKDQVQEKVEQTIQDFASRGFRSLGVAQNDDKGQTRFLGVLPLFDPPREDSKSTIETAHAMGVTVKMLTGDQIQIGKEIAEQLGMGTNILDARLFTDKTNDPKVDTAGTIERSDGFAQVYPEHKFMIVSELQKRKHITGMTGDGVNDAPALKKADVGIAVSGATDAARSAADIVLLTPGLSVIIDALKESRKIFQRMTSYATYRIAETIRVLLFMTLSILVFNFYPVTAVMIVLLALLNDGAILSIAYDHVQYSEKPESWDMQSVLGIATALGVTGVIASFGLFYLAERAFHVSKEMIQSLMYLKLSLAGHLTIFLTRTRGPFWSTRPAPALLFAVIGTQVVATLIAVYGLLMAPIGWGWAVAIWLYALAWFLVNDRVKLAAHRIIDRRREKAQADAI